MLVNEIFFWGLVIFLFYQGFNKESLTIYSDAIEKTYPKIWAEKAKLFDSDAKKVAFMNNGLAFVLKNKWISILISFIGFWIIVYLSHTLIF
jgi:hypothetical protein